MGEGSPPPSYYMLSFKTFLSEASTLSHAELFKYDWRITKFLDKYKKKEPFELVNGSTVVLKYDKDVAKQIEDKTLSNSATLIGKDGKTYKFSDLKKTKEFGGKGEGSGTVKEDAALSQLIDELDRVKDESGLEEVPIKIGNKVYKVVSAESTPGTPKSDFHLLDKNGKEIVWISHKDGSTAKDFQQWGGMSAKSEPEIFNHKETQKFIKDVQKLTNNVMPSATTYARKIKDSRLKNLSIYGNQFGQSLGQQNVTLLVQGPIKLVKTGSLYTITANHTHVNGDVIDGNFEPVFMAIYKGDRDNFDVKGARFAIQPIGSRKYDLI